MFTLALYSKAEWALEIGCSVGWSTAHIAGATRVVCIDPFTETARGLAESPNWEAHQRFLDNIGRVLLPADQVELVVGASPAVLPGVSEGRQWGFVFIDGWHQDGQPIADVQGVLPYVTEDAIICLHDTNLPDVAAAAAYLTEQGWQSHDFKTACHLVGFWKVEPAWFTSLKSKLDQVFA